MDDTFKLHTKIGKQVSDDDRIGTLIVDVEHVIGGMKRKTINVDCTESLLGLLEDCKVRKDWEIWIRKEIETNVNLLPLLSEGKASPLLIRSRRVNYGRKLRKVFND